MRLGIRGKLILISMGVIAVALLISDVVLTTALDRTMTAQARGDLMIRTEMAEREATRQAETTPVVAQGTSQPLANELRKRAKARVTIIALDGVVLGDSSLGSEEVLRVENHLERPEVREALAQGKGSSVRYSNTIGQRMMYVAVPFHRQGQIAGVVRMALPLSQADQAVAKLRMLLLGASLLALVLAGLVSTLATRRISRTLRQLAESAERMVEGDLKERTRTPGHDEIATLGKNLDRLAEHLSSALRQLKTERDLLGGILAGMQEGVLVVDQDARVIHANPALRGMLLLGSECLGKPLLEVIRNAELLEILRQGQQTDSVTSGEIELAGIKPRRLMAHVSPLQDEPGNLLVVLVDVTQLRQLESIRKDFVANASHELRTPVASMRSAAETLRGAMADPEAALSFLEIIERNAGRLHQLVEDLLDLSRIESREFRLRLEPLDMGAFGELMTKSYSRLAQDKDIRLGVDIQVRGAFALADRRAMEQVMGNLLDNAIKYCPRGASVQVRTEIQGDKIRMTVSDTGPGIPPQHLPRLFERFYRVDAGRSRELGGTGLGLAIVKHLVEAMGGTVSVESEAGLGAVFSFTLPRP